MKILSITSEALPIPEVYENENDVTVKFFSHLRECNPGVEVNHLYPAICAPKFLEIFSERWALYNRICQKKAFESKGMHIRMCPYYALRKFGWSRALTSHSLVWMNRQVEREMDMNKVDVIHAQKIVPAGIFAYYLANKYNKPLIFSVRREMDLWDHWYSRSHARKILRRASAIVSINYQMHELLKQDGFNSQFIPHGLDEFFFKNYNRNSLTKPVKILSLCRLMELKHLDKVLLALKRLKDKGVDCYYTIAGTGESESLLKSLCCKLGLENVVEFMGRVEYRDVPQVMANHDLFVMPSSPEIMGRVYFEAMSQGLPIICAKNSGIDGFFQNWKSGISVDHKSVSDIEKAIERLIEDEELRKSIGRKGRALVSKFSWNYIVEKYASIYDRATMQ